MPELPEVETLRRDLEPVLTGKRIEWVRVRRRDLRFPLPRGFAGRLGGRRVVALARRGKYLLLHLEDGVTAICHLGMSGQLLAERTNLEPRQDSVPRAKHEHLVFFLEGGVRLGFVDPRRFGFWDLCPTERLGVYARFAAMGPEPLDSSFNGAVLRAALKGKRSAIKPALLDQRVVAGVGNIYASEALFYAGISPLSEAGRIGAKRAERLAESIRMVLGQAIQAGGSTRRDYLRPNAEAGWFQHSWAVYERAGMACPQCVCGAGRRKQLGGAKARGGIRRIEQAGRSTFYCPHKQG